MPGALLLEGRAFRRSDSYARTRARAFTHTHTHTHTLSLSLTHTHTHQEPFRVQAAGVSEKQAAVPSAIVAYKMFPQIRDVLRKDSSDEGSLIGMLAIGGKEVGYFRLRQAGLKTLEKNAQ
jgi:hypothetical protein